MLADTGEFVKNLSKIIGLAAKGEPFPHNLARFPERPVSGGFPHVGHPDKAQ
jgi:hypothetical protein